MAETDPLSEFVGQVRDALSHLHDPGHLQRSPLARFALADASPRAHGAAAALRQALLDAVESLRPADSSHSSHSHRIYLILRLRYVEALDIPRILDRLSLSRSMYYAGQQQAVEAVASILRDQWGLARPREEAMEGREPLAGHWDVAAPGAGGSGLAGAERRPKTNLPIPLTSFVGREREMAEVRRLLERTRLLTLTGTGGCGKTRLATETARSFLDAYSDGVWLVQLAPISDPALVPSTVAASLGVREVAAEPIEATLARHLQPRHTLLLLDNCEHLLDATARLADSLLGACPDLSILATSRQPLGIGGEVILRVPSLSIPPAEQGDSREDLVQAILSHDASQLFLDRARSALPAFAPTLSNASAIGEICRRLDGIPLAIELAATRVRALSPDQIAARLDHDFHLLTAGSRTALPRQQTLKATLDWSHKLLSEEERVLLRRLSVFAGGFTLEAAERVCAGDGIERLDIVNLLAELVDRSLVEADARDRDVRYRLLEPVRQYAWHRLEESGEAEGTQRRHATWCGWHVQRAQAHQFSPEEATWLKKMALENDNVRIALAWCRDHDPEMGLQLAAFAWWSWTVLGAQNERRRWLDELLPLAPWRTVVRALILNEATYEAFLSGDYERAESLASEAFSIYSEIVEFEAGWSLNALAVIASEQGDNRRALGLLERAEALARRRGNTTSLAQTLMYAGYIAWIAGDYPKSRRYTAEALPAWRAIGSPYGIGSTLDQLGRLECSEGDYGRARGHLEAGLGMLRSVSHLPNAATCLCALGYLSLLEGDHAGARRDISEALRLIAPRAYRPRISRCLVCLALLEAREGDWARAARLTASAEAVSFHYRHTLAPNELADLDAVLAEAREYLGDAGFARSWAEGKAMSFSEAIDYALQEEA